MTQFPKKEIKMNENQNTFFDSKTIFAIILVGLVWFGWEKHLQQKYPEAYKTKPSTVATNELKQGAIIGSAEKAVEKLKESKEEISASAPQKETLTHFEDSVWSFDVSSRGMGIKSITLKNFKDRGGQPIKVGDSDNYGAFQTETITEGATPDFKITKKGENVFEGTAQYSGAQVTKTLTINSNNYTVTVNIKSINLDGGFRGLNTIVPERISIPEPKGFFQKMFFPSYDIPEFVVIDEKGVTREQFLEGTQFTSKDFKSASLYSFGSHYFAISLVDRSSVIPSLKVNLDKNSNQVIGKLSHELINRASTFDVEYIGYIGPKSLDILKGVDEKLTSIINFGVFGFLSRPMLKIMKGFYSFFNNWGLAIIFLTLLVRLFVLPFNIMSYKSIKAMQKIQPILKQIQEKYKDNRQELNLQTMKLMRENKVNPLGGCLPMLLQIPVFFALYQVFGQSIELYMAPFFLWITDLSLKDPFYVLPLGMAGTMFVQQKMTPTTTMDPAQQKVLLFMPVLFSLMMLNLPAALNLYIFVSSLFAVIQQLIFMNDKSNKPIIINTKAKLVEK